ncbi:MAG: PGF-pre-PGF domain-containing protein, partial [Deltaproteobacteria bacterium]|nr:PGF-pre-PGF domain-containing protein [Deltaproteobacteria bacterium]
MYNNTEYGNAINNGANNWNSSSLGNYYDDIYQTYMLNETAYSWINTTKSDADWNDTADKNYSAKVPIGFDFILDNVTYTDMQIVKNGVIQLIQDSGIELNISSNCSYTNWSTTYPNETFIFALCDILYLDTGSWYGYKTYTAGENDSENNLISHNLTVIDYHVSTYSDHNYSTNPNDYQVVLYENGTLRFNFKNLNYTTLGYNLYSGIHLGNSSSTHAKETIHVGRAGQYENETSYSTPIIRTLSSTYDANGNGIADAVYPIGDDDARNSTAIDNYPLVVASKASSPSGVSTTSFTIHTTITDPADVGISNVTLYYRKDSGAWTKYTDSATGTFTFSATSGEYYFYTVATDNTGKVEGVPSTSTYDSHTTVTITTDGGGGGGGSGGSGGGGGSTGEEYENIEFKDVSRVYISTNADISFTFDKAGNEIQYINYRALTSQGYISATIEVLKDTSTFAKEAAAGIICKNINIWVGTSGYATDANIENPV